MSSGLHVTFKVYRKLKEQGLISYGSWPDRIGRMVRESGVKAPIVNKRDIPRELKESYLTGLIPYYANVVDPLKNPYIPYELVIPKWDYDLIPAARDIVLKLLRELGVIKAVLRARYDLYEGLVYGNADWEKVELKSGARTSLGFMIVTNYVSTVLFQDMIVEITQLLEYRKKLVESAIQKIASIEEIINNPLNAVVHSKVSIININSAKLFRWVMRYITSMNINRGGRGPAHVEFDYLTTMNPDEYSGYYLEDHALYWGYVTTEEEIDDYIESNMKVAKGVDFLQHNLMIGSFRNTLMDLWPNLVNRLRDSVARNEGNYDLVVRELFVANDSILSAEDILRLNRVTQKLKTFVDLLENRAELVRRVNDPSFNSGKLTEYQYKLKLFTKILTDSSVVVNISGLSNSTGLYDRDHVKNKGSALALLVREIRNRMNNRVEGRGWIDKIVIEVQRLLAEKKDIYLRTAIYRGESGYDEDMDILLSLNAEITVGPAMYVVGDKGTNLLMPKRGKVAMGYFGDYRYELSPNNWVDNSYSADLCAITSLTMNPIIKEHMGDISSNDLMAEAMLESKIYMNKALYRVNWEKLKQIHNFIMDRLELNEEYNIVYYVKRGEEYKNKKKLLSKLEKWFIRENLRGETKGKKKIYVMIVEGHAFAVENKEHLNFLVDEVLKEERRERNPKYNVFTRIEIESSVNAYLRNKSRLHDLIGRQTNRLNVVRYTYYKDLDEYEEYLLSKYYIIDNKGRKLLSDEGCDEYDKVSIKLRRHQTLYGAFDYETYKERYVVAYGLSYGFFNEEEMDGEVKNIHNLNNDMTTSDIMSKFIVSLVEYMDSRHTYKLKLFAHNGGRFDVHIAINELTSMNLLLNGKYEVQINAKNGEIKAGGRIKLFNFSVTNKNPVGEEIAQTYEISIADSLTLLECRIDEIADKYKLTECVKGIYPYTFYDYIIKEGKKKLLYSREEIGQLALEHKGKKLGDELFKLLRSSDEKEFDVVKMFDVYCNQDTKILIMGLMTANKLYHSIDMTGVNGINILENYGRGFLLGDEGSIYRCRFLDSVTLSGFSKKVSRYYVLPDSEVSYTGIDNEYLSTYTGGLTYNSKVQTVISSIMKDIVDNEYFYIKPDGRNKEIINYLVENYQYDRNKKLKTYNRNNPPEAVIKLKNDLRSTKAASILLLDANSLYPSAICRMAMYGGFPMGHFKKFKNGDNMNDILGKRWIGYVKVIWTRAGRRHIETKKMHPIIIRTKYGNRHLRPDDIENNCLGMDDISYRSAVEFGRNQQGEPLYHFELINGVYWERSSTIFSNLCELLYKERLARKAVKDPVEESIKKILNTFYGMLLEKCHALYTIYLSDTRRIRKDLVTGENGFDEVEVCIEEPSEYEEYVSKNGEPEDVVKVNNFNRAEFCSMWNIDHHKSSAHYGVFVLAASKYIMNRLFYALGWDILYTDTDSAFMFNDQYETLLKDPNNKNLSGVELGQFKSDFDDKFAKLVERYNIELRGKGNEKYNIKEDKIKHALVPEHGVVSVLSVFNAKKQYCNVLLGQVGSDEETYITIAMQSAGKGVIHKEVKFNQYLNINQGGTEKQDANKYRDVFKVHKGSLITIDDKGTKPCEREMRNQDTIESVRNKELEERNKRRVNKVMRERLDIIEQ
jgi:hypothetical protein